MGAPSFFENGSGSKSAAPLLELERERERCSFEVERCRYLLMITLNKFSVKCTRYTLVYMYSGLRYMYLSNSTKQFQNSRSRLVLVFGRFIIMPNPAQFGRL